MAGPFAMKTTATKESIYLDLKRLEARPILDALIAKSDALIHNYRPGVPERLGLGYRHCVELRPGIVHVSVNGYGPMGPGAHRPAAHPIPGAALGGASRQAAGAHRWSGETVADWRATSVRLIRANEANPDPNTSLVIASATLLALFARRRDGVGQQVFVDMLGANAYAVAHDFVQYAGKPDEPWPDVDLHGLSATYRLYTAREGWVFIALPSDEEFARFCESAGRPGLAADPRFAAAAARAEHDGELAEAVAGLLRERGADEWERLLAPLGIGCVRADGPAPGEFWLEDPHVRENGFVVPVQHPHLGEYLRWGPLVTFDRSPLAPGAASVGGGSTRAILAELGCADAEVAELIAKGVAASSE
jgi:crotonobetainyl-CoA:carnitine CoA-transferase CaiB-like acyl-CoA transferase